MSKLGGYQIIDLRNIGLTLGASQKSITDPEILNQLRNIRNYIEKGHDYSKALNNSPKPILIRYRDAKTSEKLEVCAFASIISSNSSLTYVIKAKNIEIEVVFEEKTDDDGNKYYDIKTAKYLYSEDESVEGDLSIEGDASVGGDLSVTGDVSIAEDLTVSGDANIFEKIVDKDGHKRFIEGDITIEEITGVTKVYAKWALSGSHLLIVVCVSIANSTTISGGANICAINLPQWVLDKIVPLYGNVIEYKSTNAYNSGGANQSIGYYLQKPTSDTLNLRVSAFTATDDRTTRMVFDLLIDNQDQA